MEEVGALSHDGWLPADFAFAWFLATRDPEHVHEREYNFTTNERRYFNQLRSQARYRESKRNGTRDTGLVEGRA